MWNIDCIVSKRKQGSGNGNTELQKQKRQRWKKGLDFLVL